MTQTHVQGVSICSGLVDVGSDVAEHHKQVNMDMDQREVACTVVSVVPEPLRHADVGIWGTTGHQPGEMPGATCAAAPPDC
jgi:hypothetical protein